MGLLAIGLNDLGDAVAVAVAFAVANQFVSGGLHGSALPKDLLFWSIIVPNLLYRKKSILTTWVAYKILRRHLLNEDEIDWQPAHLYGSACKMSHFFGVQY